MSRAVSPAEASIRGEVDVFGFGSGRCLVWSPLRLASMDRVRIRLGLMYLSCGNDRRAALFAHTYLRRKYGYEWQNIFWAAAERSGHARSFEPPVNAYAEWAGSHRNMFGPLQEVVKSKASLSFLISLNPIIIFGLHHCGIPQGARTCHRKDDGDARWRRGQPSLYRVQANRGQS